MSHIKTAGGHSATTTSINTNAFVSKFTSWARAHSACSPASLRRFPQTLRRAIEVELPKRDKFVEVVARELSPRPPTLAIELESAWLAEGRGKSWAVAVIPDWTSGWRELSRDADANDLVSTFFHFASQYVFRSRAADMLGAIALMYRQPIEARFGDMSLIRTTKEDARTEDAARLKLALQKSTARSRSTRARSAHSLATTLNCLHPATHRIVFTYIRSLNLLNDGYAEEFVTALDGIVSVAMQMVCATTGAARIDRKELADRYLRPDEHFELVLLNQMRSSFGAHPSVGKWADFGEIFEDDIEHVHNVVVRLICALARDPHLQHVERSPKSWSSWFGENCLHLWNSVWFENVPPTRIRH